MALRSGSVTLGDARRAAKKAKSTRRDSTSASVARGGYLWDQYLGHFGSGAAKKKTVAKKAYVKKKSAIYSVKMKRSHKKAVARKK